MFGLHKIGLWELILILVIVLVIFGPSKLPAIGKSMGAAIREFRACVNKKDNDSIEKEI
ncbi:twin-arginine translocase TatA/TatE family subunit [Wansuia hejianensis]|uniref:Sec-independent protein translocase protein TatA n=1 Tax=Wansuia hejianensis TaxID=2763667 RepID=A0A926IN10_9FIRM|nr:twin-arginine translocase TatA/TatE family subunit [Wansuia hejianensis]MBC8591000.1 twin-arginine translocase TatA/TatE family subunit [Wansuia hejianensis]